MSHVAIEWETAEVHDGELTVGLSDAADRPWRERFDTVGGQLGDRGNAHWGAVRAKKRHLVVSDVEEGREDDVRHLLESLVREANASEPDPPDTERRDDPDARMTAAFRTFGDVSAERRPTV